MKKDNTEKSIKTDLKILEGKFGVMSSAPPPKPVKKDTKPPKEKK